MANREHYSAKRNRYLQQNGKVFSDGRTQHYRGIVRVPSPDGNKVILVNTTGHKGLVKTGEAWMSGAERGCSVAMNPNERIVVYQCDPY